MPLFQEFLIKLPTTIIRQSFVLSINKSNQIIERFYEIIQIIYFYYGNRNMGSTNNLCKGFYYIPIDIKSITLAFGRKKNKLKSAGVIWWEDYLITCGVQEFFLCCNGFFFIVIKFRVSKRTMEKISEIKHIFLG